MTARGRFSTIFDMGDNFDNVMAYYRHKTSSGKGSSLKERICSL